MIPILYEGTETSFTTNGLGRLADAISCKVVEERNATYELEMQYPVTGVHFDEIREGRIILAQPFDGGLTQPFTIYQISKPLNQVVTIKAQHISYMLSGIVVMPYTAASCLAAIVGVGNNSSTTNPFSFTTDKTVTANFNLETPTNARSVLGGSQGSILDVYGKGDYEFDRFDVRLKVNRGTDNGVTLRYGKNITDLKNVIDITNVYTGIVPFWTDGNGDVLTLPEKVVLSDHVADYPYKIIKEVDFSSNWENKPSEAQLRTAAQNYVTRNEGWKLKNNITVSFVALWNTEEYKNIAPLERVKMCDIVHVQVPKFGINFDTKVVKTDYDVIHERYNSITLGDTYYTLSTVLTEAIAQSEEEQTSHMQKAIARATKLIQGGLGGHVVFNVNADGEPNEILIMDTDSISTAVNVIRMNMNGIGFSKTGYNGPFFTAWTIDGHFVADYIDTGTLNADLIKAGVIQDEAGLNYWDMVTGEFRLTTGAKVGNYDIASIWDVSTGDSNTLTATMLYADDKAAQAEANAEAYAASEAAATLQAAEIYANNGITTYDQYLNQLKVFQKLTNNGAAQGIYLSNGQLYINGTYIKTGTLDASLVNVTNINAANIKTGILQDASGNTKWNLSTGALESKKFSISSTYFALSEQGTITSIGTDGKKIVVDKGTITGYKSNNELSAKLEIGDGYFNIANGVLAIQGVVGVTGSTAFVKSLTTEEYQLATVQNVTVPGQIYNITASSSAVTGQIYLGSKLLNLTGTCTVDGKTGTCSISSLVDLGTAYVNSGLTAAAQTITPSRYPDGVSTKITPVYSEGTAIGTTMKAIKTVQANTGSINSMYGIVQSIS